MYRPRETLSRCVNANTSLPCRPQFAHATLCPILNSPIFTVSLLPPCPSELTIDTRADAGKQAAVLDFSVLTPLLLSDASPNVFPVFPCPNVFATVGEALGVPGGTLLLDSLSVSSVEVPSPLESVASGETD